MFKNFKFFVKETRLPTVPLPSQIGEYFFVRSLFENKKSYFKFGLYKSKKSDKLAIAKQWTGKTKGVNYYWLKNEIELNTQLTRISKKLSFKNSTQLTSIPFLVEMLQDDTQLIQVVEYIEQDKTKSTLSLEQLDQILHTLKMYGLDDKLKQVAKKRTNLYIFVLFIVSLIISIFKVPKSARLLLICCYKFTTGFPYFKTTKTFAHRDINLDNVIISSGKVFLIDFELSVITNEYIDISNLLVHSITNKDTHYKLGVQVYKKYCSDKQTKKYIRTFCIYSLIFDLAYANTHSKAENLKYLNEIITSPGLDNIF